MADGRFISKSIAHSMDLGQVSLAADYLFARCIPHLDRDGRMPGEPVLVKSITCPLRAEMDVEMIEVCLAELARAGVVRWYEAGDRLVLEFPSFQKHQKGMRYDRESESKFPASDVENARAVNLKAILEHPATSRESSRNVAGVLRPKLSEVEVKGSRSTDESLPTVETSSEAGPRVENLAATVAPAVREHLWLGPDPPSESWSMGREISIAKELALGPEETEGLCIGIRHLVNAGKLGHVEPGEACTLRVAYNQKSGATPVVNLALHYWRKHAANGASSEKRKRTSKLEPIRAPQLAREGEAVS